MTTTYTTIAAVSEALGIADSNDAARISDAIDGASRWIDKLCGRRFYLDGTLATDVTARSYRPYSDCGCYVDDISSTTNLVVKTDPGDSGTYTDTWNAIDYELLPRNGIGPNQVSGWPYYEVIAVGARSFPLGRRAGVQVTARWGWAAVPDDIAMACLRLAQFVFRTEDSPLGVAAISDMGAIRARTPTVVLDLLTGYEREQAYGAPLIG